MKRLLLTFTAAILVLAGCTVGPDYERPTTSADGAYEYAHVPIDWPDPNTIPEIGRWWTRLGDPALPGLVETALKQNSDLREAAANVAEAQALLEAAHGRRLPSINYTASRDRRRTSTSVDAGAFSALFGGRGGGDNQRVNSIDTSYAQDLTVSYVLDVFGKLRRAEAASMNDLLATEATRNALMHSVIAQVAIARIRVAAQQRLLEIIEYNIHNAQSSLEVVERRYNAGIATSLDVYQARENLASVQADLPNAQRALQEARHALDVLLGRRPAGVELIPDTLPDIPDLEPVPAGLPMALLDRRPDILAAELRLAAATERVGVSIASLYPDMTLTGSGGFRSDSLEYIFDSDGLVYAAVMSIAAPLWQGGTLRAEVRAAKARVEAAAARYEKAVLTALRDVEDALVNEQKQNERMQRLEVRLQQAREAEQLARERYGRGVEGVLQVLDTERRRRLAENELLLTKTQLWIARVNLYLALGGDWDIPHAEHTIAQSNDLKAQP